MEVENQAQYHKKLKFERSGWTPRDLLSWQLEQAPSFSLRARTSCFSSGCCQLAQPCTFNFHQTWGLQSETIVRMDSANFVCYNFAESQTEFQYHNYSSTLPKSGWIARRLQLVSCSRSGDRSCTQCMVICLWSILNHRGRLDICMYKICPSDYRENSLRKADCLSFSENSLRKMLLWTEIDKNLVPH